MALRCRLGILIPVLENAAKWRY
jgi:hypothetical protein